MILEENLSSFYQWVWSVIEWSCCLVSLPRWGHRLIMEQGSRLCFEAAVQDPWSGRTGVYVQQSVIAAGLAFVWMRLWSGLHSCPMGSTVAQCWAGLPGQAELEVMLAIGQECGLASCQKRVIKWASLFPRVSGQANWPGGVGGSVSEVGWDHWFASLFRKSHRMGLIAGIAHLFRTQTGQNYQLSFLAIWGLRLSSVGG